jgi:CRP/FNR family cyclic AMP-dependent transcriptional regulator
VSYIFNFGIPGLMQALGETAQAKLDVMGSLQRYGDGQHIQSRGDETRGFSIIKSGSVCFGKTDRDGRFITTVVLEPGQCYGEFTLFAGLPRTHDGYAVGDTAINHVSKAQFDRLLTEQPELAAPIMTGLTLQLHSALEWADDLRRYPLKVRLGKALLTMHREAGRGVIEITQTELADLMGVTRVAVAGVLAKYQAEGFVVLKYGRVAVSNAVALKAWLEEFIQLEPMSPRSIS